MDRRVTLEIPEEMHRLIAKYGDLHGLDPDDYATMATAGKSIADP